MDVGMAAPEAAHSRSWIGDLSIPGPEDVVIDPDGRFAYVSSQDRGAARWLIPGILRERSVDWTKRGCIYRADLKSASPVAVRMRDNLVPGEAFHPCGIDYFSDTSGGRDRLFVVNWQAETEFSIEIFEVEGEELRRIQKATNDKITFPNDILALNEHQFYVTNSGSRTPWLRRLETLLPIPAGNVLLHDLETGEWTEVASGIRYTNGIAVDRERRRLYIASTLSRKILAFPWDPEAPGRRLSRREEIDLDFPPDNLAWEPNGTDTLWVAGSELLRGAAYMFMRSERAPSHVAGLCLPPPEPDKAKPLAVDEIQVKPVYDDDGGEISACSVAAPYRTAEGGLRFIVGCCFGDYAIVCDASPAA